MDPRQIVTIEISRIGRTDEDVNKEAQRFLDAHEGFGNKTIEPDRIILRCPILPQLRWGHA